MTKITKDVIEECAHNMMFEISEEELEETLRDFESVVEQMNFLSKISNIDEEERMTFPTKEIHSFLREDEPEEPLNTEEELKMCPSRMGNQVKLPKVVG